MDPLSNSGVLLVGVSKRGELPSRQTGLFLDITGRHYYPIVNTFGREGGWGWKEDGAVGCGITQIKHYGNGCTGNSHDIWGPLARAGLNTQKMRVISPNMTSHVSRTFTTCHKVIPRTMDFKDKHAI